MSISTKTPELSIVATIYNAAQIVEPLISRIKAAVDPLKISYEIILVDDGSRDNSSFIMEKHSLEDPQIKSLLLSRNFGQQIAMSAGIVHARGNYVLIMDGDLQNPPEAIPTLYHKIKEGLDIVYAISTQRNNGLDKLTSWLFWKFLNKTMGVDIVRSQLMMRIMTARVSQLYSSYPERIRTVAAITQDIGMQHTVINVDNEKRAFGKSNYSTLKRLNLAIDVLIDLTSHPLSILFYAGFIVLAVTLIAGMGYLYLYLTHNLLPGFTTLVLLVMFFGSVNLISLGIIARYISNIYTEVKCRPLFIVRKKINLPENPI